MVVAEPLVSMVLSLAVLGEKLSTHAVSTFVGVLARGAVVVAVLLLARSTAVSGSR